MYFKHSIIFCLAATMMCLCACNTKRTTDSDSTGSAEIPDSIPANTPQTETQTTIESPTKCGEIVCQYAEICQDNQCKTAFEMNVYLAPVPKEGDINNDSYDYWECKSETCTYHADQTYTIPKGIRVREDNVYCGGSGVKLSEMKNYTCTEQGWVCISSDGCKCTTNCRWGECDEVKCSPGEKCNHGCSYADANIEGIFECKNGNCECGTQRCGKNQICAFGDCYFAGEIKNGHSDCEFKTQTFNCGLDNIPKQQIRYKCSNRCASDIPPEVKDGYEYETLTIGECYTADIGLWTCKNDNGCKCGQFHCIKDASCIDGQCALFDIDDQYIEIDDNTRTIYVDYISQFECAIEYSDFITYMPKVLDHYHTDDFNKLNNEWLCDDSNECLCNGEKLPQNMACHINADGTEYIACMRALNWTPKNPAGYICKDREWVCINDECLCGDQPLPKNATCKNEIINCYDLQLLNDMTGYECSEKDRNWVCASEHCLCGNMELRQGAVCINLNNNDYQCCGGKCFTPQTASEHECMNGNWVVKAEDGQRHCRGKSLPPGASCVVDGFDFLFEFKPEVAQCGSDRLENWDDYQCKNNAWKCALKDKPCTCNGKPLPKTARCVDNEAYCGSESMSDWDDYQCENNHWKCALKDKPCTCNGKPLPEGTKCNNNEAYCGSESKSDWEGFICRKDTWIDVHSFESNLCLGHKLGKNIICPFYQNYNFDNFKGYFNIDISMSEQESCEHVRGCVCHGSLCPPSGICTADGCIDPLTDKPFETKEGYLVSDKLKQCANPDGCKCGETIINYREYCYNETQYISMRSCVSDNKRTIGENNYLSDDCKSGTVAWKNECYPDPDIDPSQYLVRDCLLAAPVNYSDRSVKHNLINVCAQKEGCQCIHNKCKYGDACYKGQCIHDYPCHDLALYHEDENKLGTCKPSNPDNLAIPF